jgi:ApeA N-terminal domain 1
MPIDGLTRDKFFQNWWVRWQPTNYRDRATLSFRSAACSGGPTILFQPPNSHLTPRPPGELRIETEGRVTLDLDGVISDRTRSFPALVSSADEPELKTRRIRGLLTNSNQRVLLCDLTRRGGRFASSNISTEGFFATHCLVGDQDFPKNLKDLLYSCVKVDLKGYEEWLRLSSIRIKRSKVTLQAKYRRPKNVQYSLPNGKLSVIYHLWFGETRREKLDLRESVLLRFKPAGRMSFNDVTTYHSLLQDLLILMTDTNQAIDWPHVAFGSKTCFTLYYARMIGQDGAPRDYECIINFAQMRDSFGELFGNWWTKRETYGPGFNLYLGTRRGMRLYAEHRFIMLIWGIEAYHRKKYGSTRSGSIEKKVARILEQITDPKDQKWLARSLQHAAEPNLAQRIFETIMEVPLDLDSKRVRKFAEGCAKDRNDMSHFGEHRDERRAYSEFMLALHRKSEALSHLYHLLILSEIGVGQTVLRNWFDQGFRSYPRRSALVEVGLMEPGAERPRGAPADTSAQG